MIGWIKDTPRQYRFAPRVDGQSLVLRAVSGEKEQAAINDAAMSNDQVLLWDSGNKRLKSTGVSNTELQVLNGAAVGSAVANKVLIASASKDVSGVRNFLATGALSGYSMDIADLANVGALSVEDNSSLTGDLALGGKVTTNLKLGSSSIIQSLYNSTYRDLARRSGSGLYFGNTSDGLYLQTGSSTHLYHRKGSTNYVIWDSSNDGPGSGLNADLLDGIQATQFLRSDTSVTLNGNLALGGTYMSWKSGSTEYWRARRYSTYHWELYSPYTNKSVLQVQNNGRVDILTSAYVAGNLVMHKGNDGSGSGFDADTVDGIQGSSFLRSDVDDSFSGALTFTPDTGAVIKFDSDWFINRLNSGGAVAIGDDNMMIIGAGGIPNLCDDL
jgi:hypothetical protein